MARVPITVMGFRCDRCGHEWIPAEPLATPAECPACHSDGWDQPKGRAMMAYEDFRDRISQILRKTGTPLTWTEIRTAGKLPQKFPNNRWVKKMEEDIGLLRKKDAHGIIHWELR